MYDRLQFLCEVETRQYHIIDNGCAACERACVHCQCQVQRSPFETCGRGPVSCKHRDSRHGVKHRNSRMNLFISSFERATTVCLLR
jgi:hypothetical protein